MPHSKTAAWSILPNQKAVNQTIHRLTQSGFSRNNIKVTQRADNQFDIHVHTTPDRLPMVERLIHASAPLYALRTTATGVRATMASKPLLSVGAVALAGYALYTYITKGRKQAVQSLTELPRTIRDLPVDQWADNVADAAEQVAETVRTTVQGMSEKVTNLGDQSGGPEKPTASGPASTTGTSAASSSITPTSPTGVTKPPQTTGATPQTTGQPNEQKTGQNT